MHTPEHETWCAAIAAGDRESVPAPLAEAIARCPECQRLTAELQSFRARIDSAAREEHEVLAGARQLERAEGEEQLVARLRAEVRGSDAIPRSATSRRWALFAAAAAGIALIAYFVTPSNRRFDTDRRLGAVQFTALSPCGAEGSLEHFTWSIETRQAQQIAYFTITIVGPSGAILDSDPSRRIRLLDIDPTQPTLIASWDPPPELVARLPAVFDWRVVAYDGSGTELGSASSSVSRS